MTEYLKVTKSINMTHFGRKVFLFFVFLNLLFGIQVCILRQVPDHIFPVTHLNMSHVNIIAVVLFCFLDSRDKVF